MSHVITNMAGHPILPDWHGLNLKAVRRDDGHSDAMTEPTRLFSYLQGIHRGIINQRNT